MKMKSSISKQTGFTLIELIVVIVILGILAATALPKFANLGSDARIASLNAVRGSMSSTAAMAHGKYLVGSPAATTVLMEGTTVNLATVVASGYPMADASFMTAAGINSTDFTVIAPGTAVTANSPATSATETAIIPVSVAGTTAGATCYVKYVEPAALNTAPTAPAPVTGGC